MEYFKMWGKEFSNALDRGDWEEVIRIKNESLPKKIFKYFPIYDLNTVNFEQKNNEKLTSLESNLLWGSETRLLNDPFELKTLSPDKQRLIKYGWDIKLVNKILKILTDKITVTSFSNGFRKRIPMWAHYTNNHQGYCIEFSIQKKNPIFPVRYTNERLLSATIISKLCKSFLEGYEKMEKPNDDFFHYYKILMLTFCSKSSEWEYEHEYRYFDLNEDDSKMGMLIPIQNMGLKISKIYSGLNCSDKYVKRLSGIGNKLKIPVYKMEIVENSKKYVLAYKE